MTATVTKIPNAKRAPVARNAKPRLSKNQRRAAMFVGMVGLVLTGLSLSHLASGFAGITGLDVYNSWAMAIGVDVLFVGLELAELFSDATTRRRIVVYTRPAIVCLVTASAAMNAYAFSLHAPNLASQIAAAMFGAAIPALIWCAARVASIMAMRD